MARGEVVQICAVHADRRVVVECASCERDLCDACWRHDVDGRPFCDDCVTHLRERSPAVLPLTVGAFLSIGVFLGHEWFVRDVLHMDDVGVAFAVGMAIAGFATYLLYRAEKYARSRREIVERASSTDPAAPALVSGGPYRGAPARRAVERLLPVLSGEMATLALLASLGLAALVVHGVLSSGSWVEVAAVFGGWWLVWFVALFALLYLGRRVADDHGPMREEVPMTDQGHPSPKALPDVLELYKTAVLLPIIGGPQMLILSGVLAVLLFVPIFAGFAIAALVPFVFLAAYAVLGRGLRVAVNDAPDCAGNGGASALRAAVFASTFTAPVAALVAAGWLAWTYLS